MASLVPIPSPPRLPLLGHILAFDAETPVRSFSKYGEELGDIYTLNFPPQWFVVVNTRRLAEECLNERRFHKLVEPSVLNTIRVLTGDALFTAYHGEENWGIAHRILVPAFGPASIVGMFDDMYDVLSQLVLKWERFGPNVPINPADDFTRLAFDTIALCAMSHRLNSFYTEGTPSFVQAMADFLLESGLKFQRPGIVDLFMRSANAKYQANMDMMLGLAREIIDERRRNPTDKKDLLNAMLNGVDPQTGNKLSDKSIMEQMITFLIAGHETTSGLLSFVMYNVLAHPEVYEKLRAEVDTVLGSEKIRPEHLGRMPYLVAVMREVLRHNSPIPIFGVQPFEDEVIGGKYLITKGQGVLLQVSAIHRDHEVWGDDAAEFKPERMLDGKFEALPPKTWLPFGNGARACIGRSFAWQEAIMAVATIFQKFDFRMTDPSYTLGIKQTLTIKPDNFSFYAIPRKDASFTVSLGTPAPPSATTGISRSPVVQADTSVAAQVMYVYYGSNTGSCEMFAQRIANEASAHGFRSEIGTLDSAASELPTDGPVIIITASFEGAPPDNAGRFMEYIDGLSVKNALFAGVRYAVFGCGNRDWVHTFQHIPKLLDALLEQHGAERLLERGVADAGGDRFFESFDDWETKLWEELSEAYETTGAERPLSGLDITLAPPTQRASRLRQQDAQLGVVRQNTLLTKPGAIAKHHLEIQLPEGMTYRAGDYLAILPLNPAATIKRAIARFGLLEEQEVSITSMTPTTLPTHRPVNVQELFSGYIELQQPATRRNIETLIHHAPSISERANLQRLLDNYVHDVLEKRVSVLGLLEAHPKIDIPFSTFLAMLPAMRVRQYSISSSPLWDPNAVALTLGILRDASLADSKELFQGVASNYLAGLLPGDRIQVAVRSSSAAFHLPETPETPIVMFASGSGIAPMRGFLQERAMLAAAGHTVGKALLFFGCRSPELDFLFSDTDLKVWIKQGVVDVRPAFSRAPELSEGCKYVQDRVWYDAEDVLAAFDNGAKFYTCGSTRVALGIKEACIRLFEKKGQVQGGENGPLRAPVPETPEELWASIQNERYAADVFG